MLILTRKVGESLIIDGKITVTVKSVKGNQVRLGVDAPDDVRIFREEVLRQMQEKEAAADTDGED